MCESIPSKLFLFTAYTHTHSKVHQILDFGPEFRLSSEPPATTGKVPPPARTRVLFSVIAFVFICHVCPVSVQLPSSPIPHPTPPHNTAQHHERVAAVACTPITDNIYIGLHSTIRLKHPVGAMYIYITAVS